MLHAIHRQQFSAFDPLCPLAGTLAMLREKEKAAGITPDPEIDAFMKASVQEGKASSAQTSFVLRLLGLEVAGHPHASCYCRLVCVTKTKFRKAAVGFRGR